MAVGHSAAEAAKIVCTGSNVALDGTYIQLHVGDPGAAGTTNVATETTRKLISLAITATGRATNDAVITWTAIAGTQDSNYFSLWTASTAGTFLFSGVILASGYTAGEEYQLEVGGLAITQSTVAS